MNPIIRKFRMFNWVFVRIYIDIVSILFFDIINFKLWWRNISFKSWIQLGDHRNSSRIQNFIVSKVKTLILANFQPGNGCSSFSLVSPAIQRLTWYYAPKVVVLVKEHHERKSSNTSWSEHLSGHAVEINVSVQVDALRNDVHILCSTMRPTHFVLERIVHLGN